MNHVTMGILAHVDAGKTTLSESILYETGTIKTLGRVDNKNAFLDTDSQERARGITIFSKQAVFTCKDINITLLDTPGHVDFSAEMERCLWVMDYAVLVINGGDGVQGHTKTLWRLLKRYGIPVFIFVNKMDLPGSNKLQLLKDIKNQLSSSCVDFSTKDNDFYESVAVCDDDLLERYLEAGDEAVSCEMIASLIKQRKIFPCFFGSALKMQGIDIFLEHMVRYMQLNCRKYEATEENIEDFGGRVYKISRDNQGNRLTHIKITGGSLKVKDMIGDEKVNQIRIYSGEKYGSAQEALRGMVCAVTGLSSSYPGQGIGKEKDAILPVLEPVLTYTVILPEDMDGAGMLPYLRQIEEEEPELQVLWQEETQTIQVKLMGPVQIEVLQKQIMDRFDIAVGFGAGKIIYKETIDNKVEGVGHFEPLRHYAEVHLLLEPGEPGSGMQYDSDCSEDVLDKNWQRLILSHMEEKEHLGVLTGSAITDMKITLVAGKAHTKHTEGGDFRQATYRAIRQGLMQASSRLLEPYYTFRLDIPSDCIGRAMTDIDSMSGKSEPPVIEGDKAILTGKAPVATMQEYQITVREYTKGSGSLFCTFSGYGPCHNEEEIIETMKYDPEADINNPTGSVFCSHGAGFVVPWNQVMDYMHVDGILSSKKQDYDEDSESEIARRKASLFDYSIDEEQIETIINRSSHNNERASKHYKKKKAAATDSTYKGVSKPRSKERYIIVDGYNIVHAWEELNCLVEDNLDGARTKLMDILCNYQGFVKCELIVVFDAYKVKGNLGEMFDYHNIHVVYTKEAETADSYIEKLTHQISKDYYVTVATSDGLVQLITRGQNCVVMSARELKEDILRVNEEIRKYLAKDD
ncbi:MAG: NYN domain-containing protein [Lachnospiraceae bacterium]